VSTFTQFLAGALQPMAPVTGGRAYVLDGHGNVLASVMPSGQTRPPNPALVRKSLERASGTYDAGGERYFAASRIPETSWQIVVSAPTASLYRGTTGVGRWLPWLVLGLSAVAFAAIAVLIRRAVVASGRLARSNAELEISQQRLRDRARELQRSNIELERSNADLETFAYVASHDLSAPLRAVSGFAQLLANRYRGRLDDAADEFISHMQSSLDHMQWIIDDLLAYSRVGRAELAPERVDLDAVLADVLRNVGTDVEEARATVTHDDLPEVGGDRGQLALVLQNLIANAIKFSVPGADPEVHVGAAREGERWRVFVRDNGIGIDPEHGERIFKMFQRLHEPEAYPGTGIGLAIVKRVVERHGGRIGVEPAPGGGSVFWFTVGDPPGAPAPRPEPVVAERPQAPVAAQSSES
jgi:signal transduction histidine kinase